MVFFFLHRFVASDIQRRSDAWLSGEVETLGDVAERTPKDALYSRVLGEVAELAEKEVPNKQLAENSANDSVFFLQTGGDGTLRLWVGAGSGEPYLKAIQAARVVPERANRSPCPGLRDSLSRGFNPHQRWKLHSSWSLREGRVTGAEEPGSEVLFVLAAACTLWVGIVFFATWRMLTHVREITEAASRIGHSDLNARVPTTEQNDEVSHLALTLNRMLDRIENSMHQLHTITDSLAHDLRSPLTAIRGKLEMSLSSFPQVEQAEPIVSAIEELDRLTDFLNKSLDVAEAKADALRLNRVPVDLDELLRIMIDLYEPSMSEKGPANPAA